MLWAALLLPAPSPSTTPSSDELHGLATWALQFTPKVAVMEESVVLDVEASSRLFGGKRALRDRMLHESRQLGASALAWAPTSLGALALARAGKENGVTRPLAAVLDPLPMTVLSAVGPHLTTLTQLGCRTLGDIRALPRGGIGRRFSQALLTAMDQAYGLRPEAHRWVTLAEAFRSRLELMARVELAPALLFGARRLMMQLCAWLAARHCGTTAVALRWQHDFMRPRSASTGGEVVVRTAAATRDLEHLCRLLAEHLAQTRLEAPAAELELEALEVVPLEQPSGSLLPDVGQSAETLALVLERVAARLGGDRVLRPALVEDHRLEWMQLWRPAAQPPGRQRPRRTRIPQPTFVLPQPLKLAMRGDRPMYQGPLHLLAGPHRVEGGWWDRAADEQGETTRGVMRDYWVALSEHCGVLWIYQERRVDDRASWYLHGSFA